MEQGIRSFRPGDVAYRELKPQALQQSFGHSVGVQVPSQAPSPLVRQPYVSQAATPRVQGCNPRCFRLQPYVMQVGDIFPDRASMVLVGLHPTLEAHRLYVVCLLCSLYRWYVLYMCYMRYMLWSLYSLWRPYCPNTALSGGHSLRLWPRARQQRRRQRRLRGGYGPE